MNNTPLIDQDYALRLKIVIVIVYGIITCLIIVYIRDESVWPLASQLVLQLGSVIDGSPLVR